MDPRCFPLWIGPSLHWTAPPPAMYKTTMDIILLPPVNYYDKRSWVKFTLTHQSRNQSFCWLNYCNVNAMMKGPTEMHLNPSWDLYLLFSGKGWQHWLSIAWTERPWPAQLFTFKYHYTTNISVTCTFKSHSETSSKFKI